MSFRFRAATASPIWTVPGGCEADTGINPAVLEDLLGFVRYQVRGGFVPVEHIADSAIEYAADGVEPEDLRPFADIFVADALDQVREETRTWPDITDCDRLDAAFDDLEAHGILARQNFTCCQTCGHAEMKAEIDEARADGRRVAGYVFFHRQDTDYAVDGHGLFLAFAATVRGETAAAAIGRRVAEAVTRQGLAVSWDGSAETRVRVPMQWKKRLW